MAGLERSLEIRKQKVEILDQVRSSEGLCRSDMPLVGVCDCLSRLFTIFGRGLCSSITLLG